MDVELAVSPVDKFEEDEGEDELEAEEEIGKVDQAIRSGKVEEKKDVERDGRSLVRIADPRLPTEAEVEEHYLTHLPLVPTLRTSKRKGFGSPEIC